MFESHAAPLTNEIMTDWFVLKIIVGENLQRFTDKTSPRWPDTLPTLHFIILKSLS